MINGSDLSLDRNMELTREVVKYAHERGVKEVVGALIVEFDSAGRAPLVEHVSLDEMADRYREKGI